MQTCRKDTTIPLRAGSRPSTKDNAAAVDERGQPLTPTRPLPEVTADLTLDAGATSGVTLQWEYANLKAEPKIKPDLWEVEIHL